MGRTEGLRSMNKHAVLIATAKVHPGSEQTFAAWRARHSVAISKFPGFISTDMVPPPNGRPEDPWTIIVNFESEETLAEWKRSPERGVILGEAVAGSHNRAVRSRLVVERERFRAPMSRKSFFRR